MAALPRLSLAVPRERFRRGARAELETASFNENARQLWAGAFRQPPQDHPVYETGAPKDM